MAAVLHGSARTTPRIRAELQRSKESTRTLAARYQLNPKTVAKWRARQTTGDAAMGPRNPRSTVLSPAEEAMIVEFRRQTLLPLDDVMGCLRDAIPNLTRSALHRCLQRHGISRLPVSDNTPSKRGRFTETKIGFVHIDSCELRPTEGKLIMFLAIDRISKFTVVEFHQSAGKMEGAAFLRHVVATFPYALHTVLTDNGMAFANLPKNRGRYPEMEAMFGGHIFDRVCKEHGIEHRLTKPSVLFELISKRYERRSMLITANQPFAEWNKVFPDPSMTIAAVDRLVHHSVVVEMNVESYRQKTATSRKRGRATIKSDNQSGDAEPK